MLFLNQLANPVGAKKLPFAVCCFRNPIRVEYYDVPRLQRHTPLVVTHFLKDSQWKSSQLHLPAPTILIQQGLRLPCIRHPQFAPPLLPRREANRHESSFDSPFSHGAYRAQLDLPDNLILLSDFNRDFGRSYGILNDTATGFKDVLRRTVFIVGQDGKISYRWDVPTPPGLPHPEEVLAALAETS